MQSHRGILVQRIPAEGLGGLIFALGMVALTLLAAPELRPLAAVCALGGVLSAPLIYRLHHH